MAEYIDRAEVLELKRDYGDGQYTMMLIDPSLVKRLPTTDVVEREKIDKAIAEIHSYKHGNGNMFDCGMWKAIEILKRNIGE